MKAYSWGLKLVVILFATSIYEGVTAELNHVQLKQDQSYWRRWWSGGETSPKTKIKHDNYDQRRMSQTTTGIYEVVTSEPNHAPLKQDRPWWRRWWSGGETEMKHDNYVQPKNSEATTRIYEEVNTEPIHAPLKQDRPWWRRWWSGGETKITHSNYVQPRTNETTTRIYEKVNTEPIHAPLKQDRPWWQRWWPGGETKITHSNYVQPRISETKCQEYISEIINNSEDKTENTWTSFFFSKKHLESFLIGGRKALPAEFPHMGALGWRTVNGRWMFKCGCSLISHKFTVTAAHCSKIGKESTIARSWPEIVRLGTNNIRDEYVNGSSSNDAEILRIIVHPRYSSPKKYYDIALIELKHEQQFSRKVQPVCLWNSFDTSKLDSKVSTTGWGVVDIVTKKTSAILQTTEIDIIDSELCNGLLSRGCNRLWCGLRTHQLCAGKLRGGVDACQGDSGGPLEAKILHSSEAVTMHYLIGVTSFGIGCAHPNQPGVYTRVSQFVDWIEGIVWPEQ